MAYPTYGTTPGAFKDTSIATFINAVGTNPRILVDVAPANVGSNLLGGQRVYDVTVTSTDTSPNMLILYEGVQASLYVNMGVVTITAQNTINRTVGSFISEGYQVGDTVVLTGSVSAGNNLIFATVTAVAALALTVSGTPFANDTEGAGFRVLRVAVRNSAPIAAGAGIASSATASALNAQALGYNDATKDPTGIDLGMNSLLLGALYQAVTASKTLQVISKAALR